MTHDDIGAALDRLIELAQSDTHQAARTANFLLAWWNGPDWGGFAIADLFGLDRPVASDIAAIFTYLAQHPGAIYPDAWGHRQSMAGLVDQWRSERATA